MLAGRAGAPLDCYTKGNRGSCKPRTLKAFRGGGSNPAGRASNQWLAAIRAFSNSTGSTSALRFPYAGLQSGRTSCYRLIAIARYAIEVRSLQLIAKTREPPHQARTFIQIGGRRGHHKCLVFAVPASPKSQTGAVALDTTRPAYVQRAQS